MIIGTPEDANGISERDGGYKDQEFLLQAWADKRDTLIIRARNGITAIPLRLYLSMPLREKLKQKGILARIQRRFGSS